ncbi:MAG: VOC family protein [Phycisphaeraceae bacterium]|nr:VOC family protein [Phycisphaeraceae bacterium]
MIKQLAHICINTHDLDRARWFYGEVLGMERKFDFIRDGALFGHYFSAGAGTFIEVFKGTPATESGQIRHLCLEVEDIDQAHQRLCAAGVEVTGKKRGSDDSWQFWAKDPDGTPIEFQQYTATSRQIIGGQCIVNW